MRGHRGDKERDQGGKGPPGQGTPWGQGMGGPPGESTRWGWRNPTRRREEEGKGEEMKKPLKEEPLDEPIKELLQGFLHGFVETRTEKPVKMKMDGETIQEWTEK